MLIAIEIMETDWGDFRGSQNIVRSCSVVLLENIRTLGHTAEAEEQER